jgi:hypothetical protein
MNNPLKNLTNFCDDGIYAILWELTLGTTEGFIGLQSLYCDCNLASTKVGSLEDIVEKAENWQEKIDNNKSAFNKFVKAINLSYSEYKRAHQDSYLEPFEKFVDKSQSLENWLNET